MKIIKWSNWDDDYVDRYAKNNGHLPFYSDEQYDCVITAIREAGYKFSGDYHQNGDYGTPYFDNGIPFVLSQREWGDVMAKAWPEIIKEWRESIPEKDRFSNMDYIAFAWYNNKIDKYYNYPTKKEN